MAELQITPMGSTELTNTSMPYVVSFDLNTLSGDTQITLRPPPVSKVGLIESSNLVATNLASTFGFGALLLSNCAGAELARTGAISALTHQTRATDGSPRPASSARVRQRPHLQRIYVLRGDRTPLLFADFYPATVALRRACNCVLTATQTQRTVQLVSHSGYKLPCGNAQLQAAKHRRKPKSETRNPCPSPPRFQHRKSWNCRARGSPGSYTT
jgi:hypothetical protein